MHSLQGHHPEHRRGGLHDGRRRHAGRPLQRGEDRSPRKLGSPRLSGAAVPHPCPQTRVYSLQPLCTRFALTKIILQNTGTSSCQSPFLELLLSSGESLLLLLSLSVVSSSFATPWSVACQAPLSMGFPRQEYLEWVAISSARKHVRGRNVICYPKVQALIESKLVPQPERKNYLEV